jgi:hypothetical protein
MACKSTRGLPVQIRTIYHSMQYWLLTLPVVIRLGDVRFRCQPICVCLLLKLDSTFNAGARGCRQPRSCSRGLSKEG